MSRRKAHDGLAALRWLLLLLLLLLLFCGTAGTVLRRAFDAESGGGRGKSGARGRMFVVVVDAEASARVVDDVVGVALEALLEQEVELEEEVAAKLGADEHVDERIEQTVRVGERVRDHLHDVHGLAVGKRAVERDLPDLNDVRRQPRECERHRHGRDQHEYFRLLLAHLTRARHLIGGRRGAAGQLAARHAQRRLAHRRSHHQHLLLLLLFLLILLRVNVVDDDDGQRRRPVALRSTRVVGRELVLSAAAATRLAQTAAAAVARAVIGVLVLGGTASQLVLVLVVVALEQMVHIRVAVVAARLATAALRHEPDRPHRFLRSLRKQFVVARLLFVFNYYFCKQNKPINKACAF